MAYERTPLPAFQAKFPAFSALTQPQYDAWAAEAEAEIDERYGEQQQRATEWLTAHYLALQGIGMGAAGSLALTGATSFKSGTFSASISDSLVQQRAKGGLGATPYGIHLRTIQRRLFAGPRLVRGGC